MKTQADCITETDRLIIMELARQNMKVQTTAKALYMHRNTVVYHLRKVKRLTGLDPMNFYDLIELVQRYYHECSENYQ